jgi:hypothetical protein
MDPYITKGRRRPPTYQTKNVPENIYRDDQKHAKGCLAKMSLLQDRPRGSLSGQFSFPRELREALEYFQDPEFAVFSGLQIDESVDKSEGPGTELAHEPTSTPVLTSAVVQASPTSRSTLPQDTARSTTRTSGRRLATAALSKAPSAAELASLSSKCTNLQKTASFRSRGLSPTTPSPTRRSQEVRRRTLKQASQNTTSSLVHEADRDQSQSFASLLSPSSSRDEDHGEASRAVLYHAEGVAFGRPVFRSMNIGDRDSGGRSSGLEKANVAAQATVNRTAPPRLGSQSQAEEYTASDSPADTHTVLGETELAVGASVALEKLVQPMSGYKKPPRLDFRQSATQQSAALPSNDGLVAKEDLGSRYNGSMMVLGDVISRDFGSFEER